MEKSINIYGNKTHGVTVSEHGLEKGYLDYCALKEIIGGCILNNTVREATMDDWIILTGEFKEVVMSDYIISEYGYEFLTRYTDELVFYNEELDIYIWAVTHWGTSWNYVLTNTKLVKDGE